MSIIYIEEMGETNHRGGWDCQRLRPRRRLSSCFLERGDVSSRRATASNIHTCNDDTDFALIRVSDDLLRSTQLPKAHLSPSLVKMSVFFRRETTCTNVLAVFVPMAKALRHGSLQKAVLGRAAGEGEGDGLLERGNVHFFAFDSKEAFAAGAMGAFMLVMLRFGLGVAGLLWSGGGVGVRGHCELWLGD